LVEYGCGQFYLLLKGFVVGYCYQLTLSIPADYGVLAILLRIIPGLVLLLGHILGVEVGAQRLVIHPLHERDIAIEPFPGSVVDQGELPFRLAGQAVEQFLLIPVGL